MPRINIDLDSIPDYTSVDAGRHRAKLLDCAQEESSKGNDMLTWEWEVIEGDSEGRTIKSYSVLLENALGSLKMHLKAFGLEHVVSDKETDDLVGKIAILVVTKRKGRSRETGEEIDLTSVSNVLPDDKSSKGKATKATKAKPLVSSGKDDDDIPF